jgi:MoxR-like ATPase
MTDAPIAPTEEDFLAATADLQNLRSAIGRVIVGQETLIDGLLTALLAGGHVLLEGLPGLGKTHLVKALAGALGLALARVQCTPDLMPADITGAEILARDGADGQRLVFQPGPIFANLVLVDEINRATPKTQAALLEAMQEAQVTHGGVRHALPTPFWVVATQNPIEIEGTYPLPEAQLDRFLVKLQVDYPDADGLLAMLEVSLDDEPALHLPPVLASGRVQALMALARSVVIAAPLKRAAVDLVLATHPRPDGTASHLRYGASPRALQSILRAARVSALMAGRAHVNADDLAAAALPCLRHRVLLTLDAELAGERADDILARILGPWRTQL